MARPKKIDTTQTQPTEVVETVETVPAETIEVVQVSAYKNGHFVRTYSKEVHGDDFMVLAKQFATQGYTLK